MLRGKWIGVLAAGLLVAGMVGPAMAQDNAGGGNQPAAGGNDGGGRRGGRGNFDPAQFRQRMNERMKEALGASDEEWQALQPKVEKVFNAQRQLRSGGMGMMFGRRDRGGDQQTPDTPVAKAAEDLKQTLDNKNSTAEQITAKLTALRQAREKAQTELTAAQKELRELLTQRQEAAMVMMGILE